MTGIYIHIPFCASRCVYCGFYSTTMLQRQDEYVSALIKEMSLRLSEAETISTIYIGGGTPSQLSPQNIQRLFLYIYKVYNIADDAEITMECNPDDVTPEFARHIAQYVNRVSMGAQTFADNRLRFLNRRHHAAQVTEAVNNLRQAGIRNISVDLMFGFPDETLQEWQQDIDQAISLRVEHISAYSLMYEEGTPLYRIYQQGKVKPVSDELSRAMYETLMDRLTAAGYEHYEISNFALPGMRSRHNSSYWHGVKYLGIGAAAHSYDVDTRSWNVSDLNHYIESIKRGERPSESERIDDITKYNDAVITALRTREGIDTTLLPEKFRRYINRQAQPYIEQRLMRATDGKLSFTRDGVFISDGIMADLMFISD